MAGFRGLFVRKGSTGTQPVDARKALAGLLAPVSALGARQGILAGPGDPLRVTGTAGWTYRVAAGHVVSSRSDVDGAVLWGNDGAADTAAVAAAPASGARYDLIWMRHQDPDAGESDTPELGVTSGAASGTPVRPTVPAGAVVLAEALVSAGATSTSHANVTITQVLGKTVARGGILPVTDGTDTTSVYEGAYRDRADTDTLERDSGSGWVPIAGRTAEASVTVANIALDSATLEALGPTITSQTGGFGVSGFDVTVPIAGLYAVTLQIDVSTLNVTRAFGNLVLAGVVYRIAAAAEDIVAGTIVARLGAAGTVKVEAFQNSGSSMNVTGSLLIARLTP